MTSTAVHLSLLVLVTILATGSTRKDHRHQGFQRDMHRDYGKKNKDYQYLGMDRQRVNKPNIIFVLTDDQDVALSSMDYMPKTRRILGAGGANFPNAFVTTPICCPSRSSILTGMYVHNHNVYTNNDNCSSTYWRQNYETRNFGTYLSNGGYRTGYFGKYLNNYEGDHIPPGWTEWMGLIRNTRYYNYTLNFNGEKIKHGDSYKDDYLTDLIANDSVAFLKQSKQFFPNRPVAMVLSMPAPHGPEDGAPQYQHLFNNVTTHRTASWNFAPNPDKQWLLQYTGKMEPIHVTFTDMLQQKRLQTLQSVDDAVEKLYKELKQIGELDNTYWVYTSDHGYHIGQYGLVKGKSMPYDFDTRVPFLMRGPRVPSGILVNNIVLNVDIAPTLLDIAGVDIPEHMDGKSLLALFDDAQKNKNISPLGVMRDKKAWRDTFLIERGKITEKKVKNRERLEAQKNMMILSKQYRLQSECDKAEYQPPCNGTQQWVCRRKEDGNLRIFKCRYGRKDENEVSPSSKCQCPPTHGAISKMNRQEKKLQKQFLKTHVNQPKKLKPKFMRPKTRFRRWIAGGSNSSVYDAPPVVDAGPSHILSLPQHQVTLDGSRSHDDQGIVAYQWVMVSPPASVDMVGTRTAQLHLSNLQAGRYVFELTVADTSGQTASQFVYVDVKPERQPAPAQESSTVTSAPVSTQSTTQLSAGTSAPSPTVTNNTKPKPTVETVSRVVPPTPGPPASVPTEYNDDYDDYSEYYFPDPAGHKLSPEQSGTETGDHGKEVMCRVLPNSSVVCEEEVYSSHNIWENEKESLDRMIQELKQQLDRLKDVKKQLQTEKGHDLVDFGDSYLGGGHLTTPSPSGDVDLASYSAHLDNLNMGEILEEFYEGPDPLETQKKKSEECVCEGIPSSKQIHQLPSSQSAGYNMSPREQKRQERQRRREEKKLDREILRQQKQLQRQLKRDQRRQDQQTQSPPITDPTRDCNSKNMKCFTQTNEHWHSPPVWESRRGGARHDPHCTKEGLECTRMDNYHWRVSPQWTHGPFCFCPNSNNNTYWCLRTINTTHNFLYCEFITGFISYYDMIRDPDQLRNAVYDLSYDTLQEFHNLLEKLKSCRGPKECTIRYRGIEIEGQHTKPDKPLRRGRKTKRRTGGSEASDSQTSVWSWFGF